MLAAIGRPFAPYTNSQKDYATTTFLVDRHSGQMRIMGFWDSHEALEAAMPTLEPARERLWSEFQETPTLEAYEVADAL